mmetsp:Transcript_10833/g.16219  ORF Transcript_10833/g.16219 Transcript_10833/m.16219 type:complete len:148 (+) Transcript_10833:106-549(+)
MASSTSSLTATTLKPVCFTIVGKQNNPLFHYCFEQGVSSSHDLFHMVHTSLDTLDESGGTITPGYVGLLYPTESYKTYGYRTLTNIKLILVFHRGSIRDVEVRKLFQTLHALYVCAVSNPFYSLGDRLSDSPSSCLVNELLKIIPSN